MEKGKKSPKIASKRPFSEQNEAKAAEALKKVIHTKNLTRSNPENGQKSVNFCLYNK